MKLYKVTYFGLFSSGEQAFSLDKYTITLNDARKIVQEFTAYMQDAINCKENDGDGIERYIQVVEYKDCTSNGKGYVEIIYNRSEIVCSCPRGKKQITQNSRIFFTAQ